MLVLCTEPHTSGCVLNLSVKDASTVCLTSEFKMLVLYTEPHSSACLILSRRERSVDSNLDLSPYRWFLRQLSSRPPTVFGGGRAESGAILKTTSTRTRSVL
ncbi:hypothetical protein RRG08_061174 [Elysia crispata]|uniref:Uncharacterized protein n=1 Tax=Elysia crispata TaxID=231223 RepID=A0AAE0XDF0_9GAST|nr:hypothetical protein RRG08_061174 [Elysia crispata]